ncbi:hypothetical protein CC117_20845 [Parafrankia colletiae]|uniref:Uncharacterized protein n=1 Tax=Parafrankia colletiae TaxID=573497 RepID=A0A1S1QIQ5_9ACTN|nr:hypothetical protein [Parafrankia colletiae]MCK9900619.1 hypothetical protein [Frankia sp. Cpl3]OHV34658.1 hypothetical protein CC117_20845 [Parafrankia colletiae]
MSRGRKPKKSSKKRSPGRPGSGQPRRAAGARAGATARDAPGSEPLRAEETPGWFLPAIDETLAGADVVLAADGPRALEEATSLLLGRQLRRAVDEDAVGWFDWWLVELVGGLAVRIRGELGRGGAGWEAPWRLLFGIASIAVPSLASRALAAARGLLADVVRAADQPGWLHEMAEIAATGEVWQMRDAYGTRLAVIAGFAYPETKDPSVFLFDVDACGDILVVNAGCYDEVSQAAAAWRSLAGESADGAQLRPVTSADELLCLVHADKDDLYLSGRESDSALDNWYRVMRRLVDLEVALAKRGMPLPARTSLFGGHDTAPTIAAFTAWSIDRHGQPPETAAVEALAGEWFDGCLPGAEQAASPHRVRYFQELMGDWVDGEVTTAAKALLPDWVRWNCERAGTPEHLAALSIAAAEAEPAPFDRSGSSCAS